ncbi:MFS transporter [Methanoregula sp.]|uniref:MFS transporter n=1 Tax=Methanoregula sp. TaxID=2052170 RepID=UPI00236D844F|nr:MFS transporter [Methanoregula sp.]MDD1686386.1 MFS transporter [Methanoregula sp.]
MEPAPADNPGNGYMLLIVSIALANFMAAFDSTIVTTALPVIAKIFSLPASMASWVITVYVLVMAACVLVFGKLSDVIGYKKVFLYGFALFTVASFACGFIPEFVSSFPVFLISRAVQAVGAVMFVSVGPAMITAYVPLALKGKAMGTSFAFAALGMTLAPVVGGLLTQYLSWNWIFYINIPIGIVALLIGAKVIPAMESKPLAPGFDRAGALLIAVGLASLLYAMTEGPSAGWTDPVILGCLVVAILALCAFVRCELTASDPLLDLRLLQQRNFFLTNMAIVLVIVANVGILYLFPFYLQLVQGYSPSVAGLIFTSLSVAVMAGGILGGMLYNRAGGRRINIVSGLLVLAGYILLIGIRPDSPVWFVVLCLVLIGLGFGMLLTSASTMTMTAVPKKYQGMVSGFICLERFAPLTLGIALFTIAFVGGMNAVAPGGGIASAALVNIKTDVLVAGFSQAFLFGCIVSVVLLAVALLARQEVHPDYQPSGNQKKS